MSRVKLNDNWLYRFARNKRNDYSGPAIDPAMWIPLPMLSDWGVSSAVQTGADWFRRDVILPDTTTHMHYMLQIRSVPEQVTVFVNGYRIGVVASGQSFTSDVTPFVNIGHNIVALKVQGGSDSDGGGFGDISLQAVPRQDTVNVL